MRKAQRVEFRSDSICVLALRSMKAITFLHHSRCGRSHTDTVGCISSIFSISRGSIFEPLEAVMPLVCPLKSNYRRCLLL